MSFSSAHLAAILAFSMWGLFPIYWKFFPEIQAWDLFAHRMLWSFITLMLILFFKKQFGELRKIWFNRKIRLMLIVSAFMISTNWLLYIYAVSMGKILEASMGYFLNPIINVFMGGIILKEKIRPWQWPAIGLAILGISFMGYSSGISHFPWIALTLSLTFAAYGLIRKMAHVGSLEGLAFETSLVMIPTLIFWYLKPGNPLDIFDQLVEWKIILLMLAGLVTCAPLVLFAYGARRLPLGSLGFLGYLSPSLKFVCGWLIFNEELNPDKLMAFGIIWLALACYSLESFWTLNKIKKSI
jgi:chloramphenicol-sensitive protein RarD